MAVLQGLMKFGIIDCGTNTFNLLVVEASSPEEWKLVLSNSISVKLAPHAETGNIGINRFARGIDALNTHKNNLINLGVTRTKCFATSAIREAENGSEFVAKASELLGLDLDVIDGNGEAELIYDGVKFSGALSDKDELIVDIGGGSVEFIIGNSQSIKWKMSKMLGVSRLKGQFRPNDPITESDIENIINTISAELADVEEADDRLPVPQRFFPAT
jgi:exopolyphosphatase/guanosine-5'-triphosphate,3'-diphosphate pyrophosphatase